MSFILQGDSSSNVVKPSQAGPNQVSFPTGKLKMLEETVLRFMRNRSLEPVLNK
jgi:hypothetical protein